MEQPALRPFIFVRHGQTDWNLEGRFQGRTDIPLNDKGREQALLARRLLAKTEVSRVLTSPLSRAVETARLVFPSLSKLIETEDLLIECDFGRLEGRPILQVMQEHGLARKEQLAEILPDDGEQWASVTARCQFLLGRLVMLQTERPIALVGHDAVLQGLSELLTGKWFDSQHAHPYLFTKADGSWRVVDIC
ncbi:MAG: histidine phosphatase family protein [Hoeflea sp.]|uniref:histidine phosphatase family protein n=1 Tax=Hoeflea sp. TaxID=1940281 RepID=UPI001DBA0164|nr:histidine phosphatase family protein [Hoeflea sp.]MBU4531459.1 histidine phosphatase family protein [Alphaproteobacteria bacterium]MBU4544316.1 histidine phosphatase family protein [Alphaproteobacteria bacterium]MBU4550447.1 histidine phosphatase family protein [Alphaproteobacteria bacterium]MBV1724735.1 histidine phosphatase family protein [Hoeflea sp.]MBV1760755.1 histidine phosphatase family protein [Hoeflea sp.]